MSTRKMQLKRKADQEAANRRKPANSFTYWNQEFKLQDRVAYRESVDSPWLAATIVDILFDGTATLKIYKQDSQYFNYTMTTALPLLASMGFFGWAEGRLVPSTHQFKSDQVWEVKDQGSCIVERVDCDSVCLRNGDRTIVLRGNDILDRMQRLISSPGAEIQQDQTAQIKAELWRWYKHYKETGLPVAVKDREGDWYRGCIVNLNESVGAVQVHYYGFDQGSDEWVQGWSRVSVFYEEHFEPLKRKYAQEGDLQVKLKHRKFYNELDSVDKWWDKFDKCCICQGFQQTYLALVDNKVYCDNCRLSRCSVQNCFEPKQGGRNLCLQHAEEPEEEKAKRLVAALDAVYGDHSDEEMEEAEQELLEQANEEEQKKVCAASDHPIKEGDECVVKDGKFICSECNEFGVCKKTDCFNLCAGPGDYCFDHAVCVTCGKQGAVMCYKGNYYCSACQFEPPKRERSIKMIVSRQPVPREFGEHSCSGCEQIREGEFLHKDNGLICSVCVLRAEKEADLIKKPTTTSSSSNLTAQCAVCNLVKDFSFFINKGPNKVCHHCSELVCAESVCINKKGLGNYCTEKNHARCTECDRWIENLYIIPQEPNKRYCYKCWNERPSELKQDDDDNLPVWCCNCAGRAKEKRGDLDFCSKCATAMDNYSGTLVQKGNDYHCSKCNARMEDHSVLIKPSTTTSSSQPMKDMEYSSICSNCTGSSKYVKAYTAPGVYWSLCHPCYVAAIQKKAQFFKVIYEPQQDLPTATECLQQFKEQPEIPDAVQVDDLIQVTKLYRVQEIQGNHAMLQDMETKKFITQLIDPLAGYNHVNLGFHRKEVISQSRTQIVNFMLGLGDDMFMICWNKRLDFNELKKKSDGDPEAFGQLAMETHEQRTVVARLWHNKSQSPFGHTMVGYVYDVDENYFIKTEPRLINNEGILWIMHNGIKYCAR